jgi:hypothetical protein
MNFFGVERILEEKRISDETIQELKKKKSDWDEFTFKGLMRYIQRNCPAYGIKEGKVVEEWGV